MGTRGLLGIRNNKKLLEGRYNHYDSYYSELGEKVIEYYFDNSGSNIMELTKEDKDESEFLQDGVFCEYAYVYNQENETLEIYRGFFKTKQGLNTKEQIINNLEENKEKEYFCHLIMIIDKKKNKKDEVLKAFKKYNDSDEEEELRRGYPERDIIPLEIPKNYVLIV